MKAQMRFQKIMCLIMLILGALALVYACVYVTGSVEYLGRALDSNNKYSDDYGIGARFYIKIQEFNDLLLWFSIIMILAAVILYITATNKRRKYYVTNYVATGICAGADFVLSLVAIIINASWKAKFLSDIDFEKWYQLYSTTDGNGARLYTSLEYSDSTLMFDLGTVLFVIIMVASLLLVFNLIWKIMNEKKEKKLLDGAVLETNSEVPAV